MQAVACSGGTGVRRHVHRHRQRGRGRGRGQREHGGVDMDMGGLGVGVCAVVMVVGAVVMYVVGVGTSGRTSWCPRTSLPRMRFVRALPFRSVRVNKDLAHNKIIE